VPYSVAQGATLCSDAIVRNHICSPLRQMTAHEVARLDLAHDGVLPGTEVYLPVAARMEAAAGRNIHGGGYFPDRDDFFGLQSSSSSDITGIEESSICV